MLGGIPFSRGFHSFVGASLPGSTNPTRATIPTSSYMYGGAFSLGCSPYSVG